MGNLQTDNKKDLGNYETEKIKKEEIYSLDKYYDEKKEEYYFKYECGDHCSDGVFFYRITFREPITRKDFLNMMEKAKQDEYSVLYDKDFQAEYNIKSFMELKTDYQDTKVEEWER